MTQTAGEPEGRGERQAGPSAEGKIIFDASCARWHVGGNLTDNNSGVLHAPSETGMDPAYAERTSQKKYRTTPLRGLKYHAPYFRDGSAKTLDSVVEHYVSVLHLQLTTKEQKALVEYLRSL